MRPGLGAQTGSPQGFCPEADAASDIGLLMEQIFIERRLESRRRMSSQVDVSRQVAHEEGILVADDPSEGNIVQVTPLTMRE